MKYRGTDPSYIGSLDINVYSSSSPGLNGSLVPFVKTKNLYFNGDFEPQNQLFELAEEEAKISEQDGNLVIGIGDGTADSYYNAIYKNMHHFKNNFKMSHKEDDDVLQVILDEDNEMYEIL